MKKVVLFALLALCGTAEAQLRMPDGTVNTTCLDTPRNPPLPVPAKVIPTAADMPSQLKGNGTQAVVEVNTSGVAAGWWVPRVNGVSLYLYAATWGYLFGKPDLMARLTALAVLPGGDSAMAAAIGASHEPTLNILDMCDVWSPMVARLNATKPALIRYTVKPNAQALDGSRPVLELKADGTLGRTLTGRAAAGAPCDATLPTRPSLGADLYATPQGRVSGEVSLCTKAQ